MFQGICSSRLARSVRCTSQHWHAKDWRRSLLVSLSQDHLYLAVYTARRHSTQRSTCNLRKKPYLLKSGHIAPPLRNGPTLDKFRFTRNCEIIVIFQVQCNSITVPDFEDSTHYYREPTFRRCKAFVSHSTQSTILFSQTVSLRRRRLSLSLLYLFPLLMSRSSVFRQLFCDDGLPHLLLEWLLVSKEGQPWISWGQ